jgi:hypothetical protein
MDDVNDDYDDDMCGAIVKMRISTGSEELAENVPECYFVCHKSNIT